MIEESMEKSTEKFLSQFEGWELAFWKDALTPGIGPSDHALAKEYFKRGWEAKEKIDE